jgi:hypothetical protein
MEVVHFAYLRICKTITMTTTIKKKEVDTHTVHRNGMESACVSTSYSNIRRVTNHIKKQT